MNYHLVHTHRNVGVYYRNVGVYYRNVGVYYRTVDSTVRSRNRDCVTTCGLPGIQDTLPAS